MDPLAERDHIHQELDELLDRATEAERRAERREVGTAVLELIDSEIRRIGPMQHSEYGSSFMKGLRDLRREVSRVCQLEQ